jgi:DNA-directed RNA polymerase subunit L
MTPVGEKMELKILKNEPHELEFVMKDQRHTYPQILRERLLEDSDVSFVAYKLLHPLDNDCHFIVKTKGKGAKKALEEAAKQIDKDLDSLKDVIEKKLK